MRVEALINKKLPNGKIHNGCLRVAHKKSEVESCMVDIYVLRYAGKFRHIYDWLVTNITSNWHFQKKALLQL